MSALKVLFVATSHNKLGDTNKETGAWLEEISIPYYAFKDAGAEITMASPKGGRIPLDPKSQSVILSNSSTKKFVLDDDALKLICVARKLEDIHADEFDLVFIIGGHGAMWDLADNDILKQLLEKFYSQGKPIGAVCHGVASLLPLKNRNGDPLIKGKKLTCLSNSEEGSAGLSATVPFLLETRVHSLGGVFSKGENYSGHVVADGNIVTGQNAASSNGVVEKMLGLVKGRKLAESIVHPCPN